MQLSPLNYFGICAQLNVVHDDVVGSRVEEVTMYRCPDCRELHEWEDDAEECCKKTGVEDATQPICPVCAKPYITHRDAADCCLWKDLDAFTRWRIADAVEAGGEWSEELGIARLP